MDELFKLFKNIFGEGNLSFDFDEENLCVNKSAYYLNIGKLEEALEYCEKALQINPNSKKAWNNKGAIFERLEEFEKAIESYEKAIQIDRQYKLPWFGKGSVLGKLGRYQEELTCYDTVLNIDPYFTLALFGKGTALDDLGQYEEALKYHDKALSSVPNHSLGWFNRGNTLDHLERFEEAIESYKRSIELEPDMISAWGNMANSFRELKKYDESLESYDQALQINPRDPKLHFGKGLVYYLKEQYELALYHAEKAKIFGSPKATELIVSCIEKLSPEMHKMLISLSLSDKLPSPPEKENYKWYGRTLFMGSKPFAQAEIQCKQCGKKIDPNHSFFNIHKNDWFCSDCTFDSLPEEGKNAMKNLENNPIMLEMRWDKYIKNTPSYFTYINDENMPPFINKKQAEYFIHKYTIYNPIHELIIWWKKRNLVHTSITSLTHGDNSHSFKVEWSQNLTHGVLKFDVYIRNFNRGILYPNIAMTGLRDFGHIESVDKVAELTEEDEEFKPTSLKAPLTKREGYAVFACSIAECIILAVHSAIIKKADDNVIIKTIKTALADLLKENQCNSDYFITRWEKEKLYIIVNDVKSAMKSDVLSVQRFVRIAELFVLIIEKHV